jgi:hypothetical protein
MADLVATNEGFTKVLLNNGHGWERVPGYFDTTPTGWDAHYTFAGIEPCLVPRYAGIDAGLVPLDYNDDGLVDFVQAVRRNARDPVSYAAYRNTGTGWIDDPVLADELRRMDLVTAEPDSRDPDRRGRTGIFFGDFNGDNLPDILLNDFLWSRKLWVSGGQMGRLLTSEKNELGGYNQLTYVSSSKSSTRTVYPGYRMPRLPMVVETWSRLANGSAPSETTTFKYDNGVVTDRGFRGFAMVRHTPRDAVKFHVAGDMSRE